MFSIRPVHKGQLNPLNEYKSLDNVKPQRLLYNGVWGGYYINDSTINKNINNT